MRISITGKGLEVSEYLQETIEKKARKLGRYFRPDAEMHVKLAIEKSRHIAEVTVIFNGALLRAEEATGDMYGSIDASLKKLERRVRKHRTKLDKRLHEQAHEQEAIYNENTEEDFGESPKIVRIKRFQMKPMDLAEAQLQMEMLGHNFFVFVNAETEQTNVLYKRNDGDLALIVPETE